MRAEGDLANIIVSACIWRRIGMMGDPSTGIVLRGSSDDPDLIKLRRFLVRNYYPHRIEDLRMLAAKPADSDERLRRSNCWTAASCLIPPSAILPMSWGSRRPGSGEAL